CVLLPEFALYQAYCASSPILSPKVNLVWEPARQAYSHSASVGKRYFLPSLLLNQSQKATASFQETLTTGCSSDCDQPESFQVHSGLRPSNFPVCSSNPQPPSPSCSAAVW